MRKFLNNNFFINLFSIIILLTISIFIFIRLKYAIIVNDDMLDLISNDWELSHGRFIMEPIGVFFAKVLPLSLNINIQDFAIVSQGILKIVGLILLLYMLSNQFYKSNVKNIGICFFIIFSYLLIFSILINIDYVWCFDTYQVFWGYTGATLFFLLFIQKIYDFFVNVKNAKKTDIIITFILSILVATSNELFSIVCIFLLSSILCYLLINKNINDERSNIKFFLFSLITILLITLCSLLSRGSRVLWDVYSLKIDFSFLFIEFSSFLEIFVKYIILNNIYFILPIFLCFVLLFVKYRKLYKTDNIIKYSIFMILGFLIFLFGTILLPKTCIYTKLPDKYWLLHPGLLADFSIFLIAILFLLLGYIVSIEKNIKIKILILGFSIISCSIYIFQNFSFEKIKCMHSFKSIKASMYVNDKISLFYLKQGKTAVIPKEQFFFIIPDTHPNELMKKPELYKQIYNKEKARYLIYLERNYKVDVSPGITFLPYEEAIKKYEANGGKFSEEELKEIKFSRLNNL